MKKGEEVLNIIFARGENGVGDKVAKLLFNKNRVQVEDIVVYHADLMSGKKNNLYFQRKPIFYLLIDFF